MTSNTSCCHLEICRTTIVHCRMVHPFVSRKEQTILPRCLVSKTNCYNLQTLKLRPVFHPFTVSGRRCGALRLVQMSSLSTCISKALSPAAVRIVRAEWHQTLVAVTLRFVGRRSFTAGWFIRLYHGKNRQFCKRVRAGRIFSWPCARKNDPSRKFIEPQLWYFQSSRGLSHGTIFSETGVETKEKCGVSRSGVCWRLAKG